MGKVLYDSHIRVMQPDEAVDALNVTATYAWEGFSTAQELGLLQALHAQQGQFLDKAIAIAAKKGITPDAVEVPTPAPAPDAASATHGMAEPWASTP